MFFNEWYNCETKTPCYGGQTYLVFFLIKDIIVKLKLLWRMKYAHIKSKLFVYDSSRYKTNIQKYFYPVY